MMSYGSGGSATRGRARNRTRGRKQFRGFISAAAIAVFCTCHAATGAVYFWDPSGTASVGGSGTWDASSAEWSLSGTGGSDIAWLNTTPNSDTATFTGSGGIVTVGTGSDPIFVHAIAFQANYTLNASAGSAALILSGTSPTISVGSTTDSINANLIGTSGFAQTGSGTLQLGGSNSGLSGTTTISGSVVLNSAASGSENATWNLSGGKLAYNPAIGGTNQNISLGALSGTGGILTNTGSSGASDVITYSVGALNTATSFAGQITDSAGGDKTALLKTGSATLTLTGTNTYSGPTTVNNGILELEGATGTLSNSPSITLNPGGNALNQTSGTLIIDNNVSQNRNNRLLSSVAMTFNSGSFLYNGYGPTGSNGSSEQIGNVLINNGINAIEVMNPGPNPSTVTANSLTRPANGGTVTFLGANLGKDGVSTTNVVRFLITNAPTMVGTGAITTTDTPTEKNTPIIPFANGGETFVTYSPTSGVRPLNTNDEYATSFVSGDNVSSRGGTLSSSISVNSLLMEGTLTIAAGTTLNISSGALLFAGPETIAAGDAATSFLGFNNGEAIITAKATQFLPGVITETIGANLTNLTSLTVAGGGYMQNQIVLNQGSATTFSGPVYLQGAALTVSQEVNLGYGTGNNAITFAFGNLAALQFTGSAFTTTTKGISLLGNGNLYTQSSTDSASLGGLISGPGSLLKTGTGTITLANPANTYTGATDIDGGALKLSANSNNNVASSSTILAGDQSTSTTAILDATGLTATGGFQLHSGQTLAGFGTVKPPAGGVVVTAGSIISAGDTATQTGNLKTTGEQVWNGGGTYYWLLNFSNVGSAASLNNDKTGTNWNQLTISSLSITATRDNPFVIDVVGINGSGSSAFDPTKNYKWVAANVPSGAITGNLGGIFAINVSGFSIYSHLGPFTASIDSTDDPGFSDLVITYSGAPEPTSLSLLFVGAGGVIVQRKRRRMNDSLC